MVLKIGDNRTTNTGATVLSGLAVGGATSVVVFPANPNRIYVSIGNDSVPTAMGLFIKLQAASVDNLQKGIWVPGGVQWSLDGRIYTGEISVISMGNVTVFGTEF